MNGDLRPVDNSGHIGHTYLLIMQSGNNIHLQQHETNMINEEWNKTQNDAPFVTFYDMRAVTFVLLDEMANVDRGTAVVYSYTPIKPLGVSQVN